MRIFVISAALPPDLDGIGDYTAHLCCELARSAEVTVLTACINPNPIAATEIRSIFSVEHRRSVRAIEEACASAKPDWIVLQYCPFSYGKWGLNLDLPEVIHRTKRCSSATKFALMVHEPFVPIKSVKLAVMTSWQRWQLRRLGAASDLIMFSIQPWADKFSKWFPVKRVIHLPVGSNIDRVSIDRVEARYRLGIPQDSFVLGLFGWMHDSRMMDCVLQSANRLGSKGIVMYIGPNPRAASDALSSVTHITEGPFPAIEISKRFAALDISMSTFNDGISTRRGSFMCAMSHGIPTVGTKGFNTDDVLLSHENKAFLLSDVNDRQAFADNVDRLHRDRHLWNRLSVGSRQLYNQHFSWPVLGRTLLAEMSVAHTDQPAKAEERRASNAASVTTVVR
jgi:glycosyltransferase involved in cell wall biosynthesis